MRISSICLTMDDARSRNPPTDLGLTMDKDVDMEKTRMGSYHRLR
jgi:hypothetical protein